MTKAQVKIITVFSFSCLVTLLNVGTGHAAQPAPCTPGTDCYCDKVKTVGNSIYDANLLLCEDFEAPTLRLNQGVGNGAPYYGPWSDGGTDRGGNSYWYKKYNLGVGSNLWQSGTPASPTLGSPCSFSICNGVKVWERSNLWSANAYDPRIAIYSQNSDFTAENGALTVPTNAANGGTGIYDGNGILVHRMSAGFTNGIFGEANWTATTELGLTQAIGYASNAFTSGITGPTNGSQNASWKHNEFKSVTNGESCGFDPIFLFYSDQVAQSRRPLVGQFLAYGDCSGGSHITGGVGGAYCKAIVATVGWAYCNGDASAITYKADDTLYQQSRDFPDGTWTCVRGWASGIGTTSARMRIWMIPTAGPRVGVETLFVDFTYNDDSGSNIDNRQGYKGVKWNNYANTNQGGGYVASTATTFRYEDNVHIRAGAPVSCSQIGYIGGSGGDLTPPVAPTGLKIF